MSTCVRCRSPIRDEFVFAVRDEVYHRNCLQCAECKKDLDDTCLQRNGEFYCMDDFYSRFGPTMCGGCGSNIQVGQLSTKIQSGFFHSDCVRCLVCNTSVTKGMNVGFDDKGQLFCEEHFQQIKLPESPPHSDAEVSTPEKDEDDEVKTEEADSDSEKKDDKNKRRGPRTTIKAKQLEILKNVFNQTPKPTRLMREQLAKETGLPMRVIQVWFQNKRSKEKRMHQMRFMARAPFLPPHGRRGGMRGFQGPPDPRFCFPPNAVAPYDFPPGPNGYDCPPGMFPPPPQHDFGYPMPPPPTSSPLTNLDYCNGNDPSPDPLHSFPSPPPQTQDLGPPSISTSENHFPPQPDQCYPSPPLSLEFPPASSQAAAAVV